VNRAAHSTFVLHWRRATIEDFVLTLALIIGVIAPIRLNVQTVLDPTAAEFNPSPDHSATLQDGRSIVDRYDLEFYLVGASSPFQTGSLGKPAPASDGKIRANLLATLGSLPSPAIDYEATVSAIGPGGSARSPRSNTFSFSTTSAAPTTPCSYSVSPTSQSLVAAGGRAA
jgi:hypothetical protein